MVESYLTCNLGFNSAQLRDVMPIEGGPIKHAVLQKFHKIFMASSRKRRDIPPWATSIAR